MPSEERKPCVYFQQYFLSLGMKPELQKPPCRYGLFCRDIHRLADVLPGLKQLYKKWEFGGTMIPRNKLDSTAPSEKRIKLDQSKLIQEPLLLSSMIAKLRKQPLDVEYGKFLAENSPVIQMMQKTGWTKTDGLGPIGRQGKSK